MAELRPVSDIMLARYVAGDLHGAQLERVERAIAEIPGLAERVERVRKDRDDFLKENTPEAFAHRIITRITVDKKPRSFWHVWWMVPPVGVAAALLIGVFANRAIGPQGMPSAAVTTDDRQVIAAAPEPTMRPQEWQEEIPDKDTLQTDTSAKKEVARDDDFKGSELAAGKGPVDRRGRARGGDGAGTGGLVPTDASAAPRVFAQPPAEPRPEQKPTSHVEKRFVEKRGVEEDEESPEPERSMPSFAAEPPDGEKNKNAGPPATAPATVEATRRASDARDASRVAPTSTLTREEGGHMQALTSADVITAGSVVKVTASGGQWVTVIGVRRDGAPFVYGQAPIDGIGVVNVRVRPTSSRTSEALFIVIGDSAVTADRQSIGTAKDAGQLPLRLSTNGTQRRVVIQVSAAPAQ